MRLLVALSMQDCIVVLTMGEGILTSRCALRECFSKFVE